MAQPTPALSEPQKLKVLSRVLLFASPVVLMAAVVATYAPAADGPFFFDDIDAVIKNPNVRELFPLHEAMSAPRNTPFISRPLVSLSAAINYATTGLNPAGFRWTNILLHGLAAISLFGALSQLLKLTRLADVARPLSTAVALLWAVHWIHIDSVAYITQRSKVMLGLFAFLTIYASAKSWTAKDPRVWRLLAATACVFGMLSKESMVGVPLVVLLLDRQFASKSFADALKTHRWLYVGLAASWGVLLSLMITSPRSDTVGGHLGMSPWHYLLTQSEILVHYFSGMVMPRPFLIHHEWPMAERISEVWLTGGIVSACLVGTVVLVVRRHWLGLVGAVVFITLGPTSSVVPMTTEVVAERRMYVPAAALIAGVVVLIALLFRRFNLDLRGRMLVGLVLVIASSVSLIFLSQQRMQVLASESMIWRQVVDSYPDSWKARHNLAMSYRREENYDASFAAVQEAVKVEAEDDIRSSALLIEELINRQRIDEAEQWAVAALERRPDSAHVWMQLGRIRLAQNRIDEAEEILVRIDADMQDDPDYHAARAVVDWRRGRLQQALAQQRRSASLRDQPGASDAFREALILKDMGLLTDALAAVERALRLNPNFPAAKQFRQFLLQQIRQATTQPASR